MSYIWEKEVSKIDGNLVTFTDDTTKTFTEKQLSYLVTEEPKDATAIQGLMLDNIVPEIFQVLLEHNVRKWDINAIVQTLIWSYNQNFNIAIWKAFWTFKEWAYPESYPENITMEDIANFKNS